MTGAFLGIATTLCIALTGLTLAAVLRLRSLPELILGAYVISLGEVVAVSFALTPFHALRRETLIAVTSAVCVASVGIWFRAGRPLPRVTGLRDRVHDAAWSAPANRILTIATAFAGAYVLGLVVGTPPNNWDSLRYHLTRAAFWVQNRAIGYVADAFDPTIDVHPPNGEIALAFMLQMTHFERVMGFLHLSAWLVSALAISLLARKLGLSGREAFFGSAVFLLLPIVVLQASTTQNDLLLASLLLAATVFILGTSRQELWLAAAALAVALGTKFSAVFACPILLATAYMAHPATHRVRRMAAVVAGCLLGSYWYVVNSVNTGNPLGHRPDGLTQSDWIGRVLGVWARVLDALELTGVRDWGGYAYPALAAAVAIVVLTVSVIRRHHVPSALLTGVLLFVPLLIFPASYIAWRAFAKLHDLVGGTNPELPVGGWEPQTLPSEDYAWFGPVGIILAASFALGAPVLARRARLHGLATLFALAPIIWLLLVSAVIAYDPWQGRYFMYPVALSAALWGLLVRRAEVALAAATVAVLIAGVTLAQYDEKPGYVWGKGSVWVKKRWEIQSIRRPEFASTLEFIEKRIPETDSIALALGENDWAYPAFGPRLTRQVVVVPLGSSATATDAKWLLASTHRTGEIDRNCWRPAHQSEVGTIYSHRSGGC